VPFPSSEDPKRAPSFSPARTSTSTTLAGLDVASNGASAVVDDDDDDNDIAGAGGSDGSDTTSPDTTPDVASDTTAVDDASRLSTSRRPPGDSVEAGGAAIDVDQTLDPDPPPNIDPNTGASPPDELAATLVTGAQGAAVPRPTDDEPA